MMEISKMIELQKAGFTTDQISAMVMSEAKTVSTSKSGGGSKKKEIPLTAVDMSDSVANSLRLFDGILDAKFIEWNGKLCIVNKGSGGKQLKWNALFQPLSQYEGKVIPAELIGNCETALRSHEEQCTVLEATIQWAKTLIPVQVPTKEEQDVARKKAIKETPKD